jgi:hypothetical protein
MSLGSLLKVVGDNAQNLVLGALLISAVLRGLDKMVEHMGERHPASKFWPALDKCLDRADVLFGWFGDLMSRVLFTRKGK